jgi:phenylpropionate dioxygenase-like ring-hydroxylating dioxygenase large terminal subunit
VSRSAKIRPPVDYRVGIRSYKNVPPGSLAEKMPYVDYGTDLVDKRRYIDPKEAQLEWDKMWTKVWTLAGMAADIPNPGDWFKYDLGVESFVVVRGDDGAIRAFYNVCPHRGNQIVRTDFGTVHDCFRCAFHSWQFLKDGTLKSIKEPETFRPEALKKATGLTPVRCDVWAGFVFITMDDNAPPLLDFLGILPEHLKNFHMEKMRVVEDIVYPYDANWKTLQDAFLEFYHGDTVHPELAHVMETYHCQYDVYPKGISRMILPYGYAPDKLDNPDEINDMLRDSLRQYGGDPAEWEHLKGSEYKQAIVTVKRRLAKKSGWNHFDLLTDDQIVDDWNYSIFPNVTFNIMGEAVLVQTFRPHPQDAQKSIWRSIMLSLPAKNRDFKPVVLSSMGQNVFGPDGWDGSVRPPILYAKTPAETGFILAQDCELIPPVQRGINSRSFKGFNFGEQEIRIRHFLAELDKYLQA